MNYVNNCKLLNPQVFRLFLVPFSPEPYQPWIDKLDLRQFYSLPIPKSYLYCTEDTALPQGEWGWHPRMSNRLGQFRFVQMPGSHEMMFSNPVGLAEKIIVAGRD
ncbi:salicylate esterase [Nostoc sp. FACHB-888]|uniref:salicylate esterase n=1 Tax=Nostoc sp. FACHB-888 TaxID=2692842 RepID=UPI001F559950|nr:salicylate esterase [Nostoc sp. FACHB-888]